MLQFNKVKTSVAGLADQLLDMRRQFPKHLVLSRRNWTYVLVCGMGGSALAADLIRYALWQELKVPIFISNNYDLPASVSKNTLVIAISYSGTTEEVKSCLKQAKKQGLATCYITGNTKQTDKATKNFQPIVFQAQYNPSGQPRLGLGYTAGAFLYLLQALKLVQIKDQEIKSAINQMKQQPTATEVKLLQNKSVIILASEHLIGTAHVLSNQLNETAKTFAPYFTLPEADHHLLEGLGSLRTTKNKWLAIFLTSADYHARTQKRYQLTKQVFKQQGINSLNRTFRGSRLTQALAGTFWGDNLVLALALKANLDPTAIPWVKYFKQHLR